MAMTAESLTTQNGSTSGSNSSLSLIEQTGTADNPATYVSFQTPGTSYLGYQTFHIPSDAIPSLISNMLLQVNFKGTDPSQIWTFSVYDWSAQMWVAIGNTNGTTVNRWNSLTFRIRNITRIVSSSGEVRIRLQSNNATGDAKLDYEAIHITYYPVAVSPSLTVPVVPGRRPGVTSVHMSPNP